MTSMVQALGWTLLHFLWQGTLLAGAIALALWTLEGRDSRLRYALACGGLLLMLAAPPLTFYRLRMQPSTRVQAPLNSPALPSPIATAMSPLQTPDHDWRGKVDRAIPWVVLLWASGSLVMSLRLTGGWVWLQWLRRRPDTHPAPDADQLVLLRLCQRMGVGSNLRLLLCKSVPGPTVLGWLRPVILIPPAMFTGLNPQQLELILAHELAHVLRHDYLVNLFQSIAEVLFFFHPAVWWVSKKIRQEREQASDDLAVHLHGDALDYAQALTALEALASRINPSHPAPRLALGAQGGDFMSRIHRLISPTAPTLLAPRAGLVVLLLLGGAFALQATRTQDTANVKVARPEQAWATLPKGTVRLRRYDMDSPNGHGRTGTIDMLVHSAPLSTMERALSSLRKIPISHSVGFVDLDVMADPSENNGLFTYKFTGVDSHQVDAIIHGQAALAPIEKKPGMLVIQRINSFTDKGGLLPQGLHVYVWAGDIPADLVLQALDDLEAMTPKAGIRQEIRRLISPGMGKAAKIQVDVEDADPIDVRNILETAMAQPQH